MKRILVFLALLLLVGAGAAFAEPVDMIVLLDTSESMLPYYSEVDNFLIKDIVTKELRTGDTFNLLTFAGRPEIEISRQIESQQDIDSIINRVLLLQPLGRYTDFVLAVKYLYQFAVDLPLSSKKVILILTDGIHDPPPGSSFPNQIGPNGKDLSNNKQEIIDVANEIRQRGWEVHILQFPFGGIESAAAVGQPGVEMLPLGSERAGAAPGAAVGTASGGAAAISGSGSRPAASTGGGPQSASAARAGSGEAGATGQQPNDNLFRTFAQRLGVPIEKYQQTTEKNLAHVATGAPGLVFPGDLGRVGYDITVPFVIRNYNSAPMLIQLDRVLLDGKNILQQRVSLPLKPDKEGILRAHLRLPPTLRAGKQSITVDLEFAGSERVFPHTGTLTFTLRQGILGGSGLSLVLLPVLFGLILIACVILIFVLVRRVVESLASAAPAAVRPRVQYSPATTLVKPVEMRVSGQNPNIGGRNIHPFGSGGRRSVGGGGSSYLIYLYPLPPHIAELSYDGERFVFTPLKGEFFPSLSGPISDCLGKEIRCRTVDGREVVMVFRPWISPLDQLNRIMHQIDRVGKSNGAAVAAATQTDKG